MLRDLAPIILAVLGGGGIFGGIYALLKLRPEAGQITVVAAQGAVVVQQGVIETLRDEIRRHMHRIEALEAEARTTQELQERVRHLEEELNVKTRENVQLRERVANLEAEVERLTNGG